MNLRKTFLFIVFFLSVWGTSFAQVCPNYEFTKDAKFGDSNPEIKVLQILLNSDRRTRVAVSGPGSLGAETEILGNATREALKRFQALFIEYIEVADGVFNSKTRDIANVVCKSGFRSEIPTRNQDPKQNEEPKEKKATTSLTVSLSSEASTVAPNNTIRVSVRASAPLKSFDAGSVIVDGATAERTFKVAPNTYSLILRPNEGATNIEVQIEADKLEGANGETNEESSNLLQIKVSSGSAKKQEKTKELEDILTEDPLSSVKDTLQSLLDKFFGSAKSDTQDCSKITGVHYTDTSNPCYGQAPIVGQQNTEDPFQTPEQPQPPQQPPNLGDLLKGLGQGGGGDKGGGSGGGDQGGQQSGQQPPPNNQPAPPPSKTPAPDPTADPAKKSGQTPSGTTQSGAGESTEGLGCACNEKESTQNLTVKGIQYGGSGPYIRTDFLSKGGVFSGRGDWVANKFIPHNPKERPCGEYFKKGLTMQDRKECKDKCGSTECIHLPKQGGYCCKPENDKSKKKVKGILPANAPDFCSGASCINEPIE